MLIIITKLENRIIIKVAIISYNNRINHKL